MKNKIILCIKHNIAFIHDLYQHNTANEQKPHGFHGYHIVGLSITLKAGVKQLRWLWGAVAQRSKHLWLKQGTQIRFPAAAFGFLLQLAY